MHGAEPHDQHPATGSVVLHSEDVEEATEQVGRLFHPHQLTRVEKIGHFEADLSAVAIGPVVAGRIHYNSNSDLYCPSIDGYHVNIATGGPLLSESEGDRTTVEHLNAVVYDHETDARLLTPPSSRLNIVALKVTRETIESVLGDMLGFPVGRLRLRGRLDLSRADGSAWRSLVLSTHAGPEPNPMLSNPAVADPLNYAIVAGLLSLIPHDQSSALAAEPLSTAPATIRNAVEFIEAHAELPLTPIVIAKHSGVSVRALQRGFREHTGQSPMQYLRGVRMRRIHHDLLDADPESSTVAAVAGRWGIVHLGRFSVEYKHSYGISPSETLHRTSFGLTDRNR
ncbi:AraC family transcriptional regulator [Gordonia polyisoprenivorans]|uniref:AraC family transcriptional regulator n=1 Tax=Gordonia polyisoprenivorans TaxID=84595 RepID=UPI001AD69834|nr:AraC family transcriptional regulator [Gordonia polyisoprenivorans]QTI71228.1 AraC family transcriptional regulator [Gordonia polyisoprenivorans]